MASWRPILLIFICAPAFAHTFTLKRRILVQSEANGAASVLVTLDVPRTDRTEWLRRSWDRNGDGRLDPAEASAGARELSQTALTDLLIEADDSEAQCSIDVRERGIDGALDDRAFELAILLDCATASEWVLHAGNTMPTTVSVLRRDGACFGQTAEDDRTVFWIHCP